MEPALKDVGLHPLTAGAERDGGRRGGEDQAQPEGAGEEGTGTPRLCSVRTNTATEQKHGFHPKTLSEALPNAVCFPWQAGAQLRERGCGGQRLLHHSGTGG